MNEAVESVIIGGGQAGLSLSCHLKKLGREHVILERARVAERWRSERWDSLAFQFPNWSIKLPGFAYQTNDPEGFASKNEVVKFIEDYAARIEAPVWQGVEALSVHQEEKSKRFRVVTREEVIQAANVVIAIGPYHVPIIPASSALLPTELFQIHSRDYRSPEQLPHGAVLVVGSGASGLQIAEELHISGRKTYLSVGRHQRTPRRYGGRDIYWWLDALGILNQPIQLGSNHRRFSPHVTGVGGGHDINPRKFASDGITLLGKLQGIAGSKLIFAPDLQENLALGEAWYVELTRKMSDYAQANGWSLPAENLREEPTPALPASAFHIEELDVVGAGITSIVWCSGFQYDFGIIKLEVFDGSGQPIHTRGVTRCPGLYFLGLKDMYTMRSSHLSGVGDDAAYLAEKIVAR